MDGKVRLSHLLQRKLLCDLIIWCLFCHRIQIFPKRLKDVGCDPPIFPTSHDLAKVRGHLIGGCCPHWQEFIRDIQCTSYVPLRLQHQRWTLLHQMLHVLPCGTRTKLQNISGLAELAKIRQGQLGSSLALKLASACVGHPVLEHLHGQQALNPNPVVQVKQLHLFDFDSRQRVFFEPRTNNLGNRIFCIC